MRRRHLTCVLCGAPPSAEAERLPLGMGRLQPCSAFATRQLSPGLPRPAQAQHFAQTSSGGISRASVAKRLCNRSRPSAVRFAVEYAVDTQPLCDVLLPASRFLRFRKRGLGLRLLLLPSLGHARHGLCFPDPTSPLGVSPSQRGSDEIKIERENECYIRRMKHEK